VIECVTHELVKKKIKKMDGNLGRKRDEVESLLQLESDVQTKKIMNWNTVLEQWEDVLKELVIRCRWREKYWRKRMGE